MVATEVAAEAAAVDASARALSGVGLMQPVKHPGVSGLQTWVAVHPQSSGDHLGVGHGAAHKWGCQVQPVRWSAAGAVVRSRVAEAGRDEILLGIHRALLHDLLHGAPLRLSSSAQEKTTHAICESANEPPAATRPPAAAGTRFSTWRRCRKKRSHREQRRQQRFPLSYQNRCQTSTYVQVERDQFVHPTCTLC